MNPFRNEQEKDDRPAIPPPLPPFRSVSMMPPPAALRQPLGSQQSQFLHKSHSSPMSPLISQPSSKPTSATTSDEKWTWKLAQVAPVPLYHPLERTAISTSEPLDLITERISTFMKAHSIHCSYDDNMGRVSCSTDCLLQFVVQLWKKNNSTVIEVQRRQGCSIAMQGLRHQLKETILHGDDGDEHAEEQPKPALYERACAFVQQLPAEEQQARGQDCRLENCLDLCQDLLNSDLLDQNRLGLESLAVLTDLSKVLGKDAEETSRLVVQDASFQKLLIKFFTPESDVTMSRHDEHMHGALHLLAVKAVAHALDTVSNTSKKASIDLASPFWQTVMQAELKNVQRANEKPIEASLSLRSLRLLQTLEPSSMASMQHQQSLRSFLQTAHDYGRQHNRSLQRESELFMMRNVY